MLPYSVGASRVCPCILRCVGGAESSERYRPRGRVRRQGYIDYGYQLEAMLGAGLRAETMHSTG